MPVVDIEPVVQRPAERMYVDYMAAAAGRVAFGGTLLR